MTVSSLLRNAAFPLTFAPGLNPRRVKSQRGGEDVMGEEGVTPSFSRPHLGWEENFYLQLKVEVLINKQSPCFAT